MLMHSPGCSHPSSSLILRFASTRPERRSGTTRVLDSVGQNPDVFVHAFKWQMHMEGIQARSHVVAFWVGAHQPSQIFEPVANQLRLAQLLGHHCNPLVCRPELGVISFHRHLPISCETSYTTRTGAVRPPELLPSRAGALSLWASSSTVSGDSRGSENASSCGSRSVRFCRMASLRSSSRWRKAICSSRLRI